MSATPRFWPVSRAAARRRVSRRGFFFVAGAHAAAVVGVVLLSTGPAKTSVAAGGKTPPTAAAPALSAEEAKTVVWMDPATFETPPAVSATPSPEELVPPDPPPRPAPVRPPTREPFLAPTPRPAISRPKPVAAVVKSPKKPSTPLPPLSAKTRSTEQPPASRPRLKPFLHHPNPAASDDANRHDGSDPGADPNRDDGPAGAGGTDWYAAMLHERFYARWEQPTSVFATTRRYTATLRLRIERDGRISDYQLARSSGLVPMDESVLAAAARVGRVDPPPSGLLRGGAYVVNVGFVRE